MTMELHEFDALLDAAELPESEEQVCLRADLQVEWERLSAQLEELRGQGNRTLAGSSPEEVELEKQRAALEQRMVSATVTLRFRALERKAWMKIVDAHPPRKDNHGDRVLGVNQRTFFDAIIGPCLVEPKLDEQRVTRFLDKLTDVQFQRLADAAWGLNCREKKVPFSLSTSPTTRSTDAT